MKVKLLKKVRKDYIIERIDKLASNPNEWDEYYAKVHGLPFYLITSTGDNWYSNTYLGAKTFKEAQEVLIETIIDKYSEQFRHKDAESEKVWHNSTK